VFVIWRGGSHALEGVRGRSEPRSRGNPQQPALRDVALALPAGKYALFASGTVEGSDRRSVHCFIETTTTTVATSGAKQKSIPCSCRSRRCSACSISPRRGHGARQLPGESVHARRCRRHQLSPHGRLGRRDRLTRRAAPTLPGRRARHLAQQLARMPLDPVFRPHLTDQTGLQLHRSERVASTVATSREVHQHANIGLKQ
jgi:hypothetical protein